MVWTTGAIAGPPTLSVHVILIFMPIELPVELKKCPLCGVQVPENDMRECSICHSTFCLYCAMNEYGKIFCSKRCRGFFFWGDSDENEKEY